MLDVLKNIKEIRGRLQVALTDATKLPYLSNLKTIGSDIDEIGNTSCLEENRIRRYSIIIESPNLVSIDLSSLESISNGGIILNDNPNLCYIGNLSFYLTDPSQHMCLLNDTMRDYDLCSKQFYYV